MPRMLERLLPRKRFDNRDFWNNRYLTNPELGSGVGSRGDVATRKRALIEDVWRSSGGGSVLDIGCGDLEMLDLSVFPTYTGVDVSDVAVTNARERFPQHTFIHADFGGRANPDVPPADLVLCFDVLIHQFDAKAYRRIVERIVERVRVVGLVSAYDNPPQKGGPIIAYHEPIGQTLRAAGARRITKIGGYRGLSIMRFEPPQRPAEG